LALLGAENTDSGGSNICHNDDNNDDSDNDKPTTTD